MSYAYLFKYIIIGDTGELNEIDGRIDPGWIHSPFLCSLSVVVGLFSAGQHALRAILRRRTGSRDFYVGTSHQSTRVSILSFRIHGHFHERNRITATVLVKSHDALTMPLSPSQELESLACSCSLQTSDSNLSTT